MDSQTLAYYAKNAQTIAKRYESITSGLAPTFEKAYPAKGRILDVGCGSGRDLAILLKSGRDVYGLEACPQLIDEAVRYHPELSGRIIQGVLPHCAIPFDGSFDGVLCSAVLMHIAPVHYLDCIFFIKESLKPGGIVLYSVPASRPDVGKTNHRDAVGRLFVEDAAHQIKSIFLNQSFQLLEEFENTDSLGREGVRWSSVLMQRI